VLLQYGDLTGSVRAGKPTRGSWTAIYDGGDSFDWSTLALWWNSMVPAGGTLEVLVASSDTDSELAWGAAVNVPVANSGIALPQNLQGRYLRVTVMFTRSTSESESPVLYDIFLQVGLRACRQIFSMLVRTSRSVTCAATSTWPWHLVTAALLLLQRDSPMHQKHGKHV
jgi:hypothetical protein